MTGRIVHVPTVAHSCPVRFFSYWGTLPIGHPAYWARPGTVLECDCGRTFVAHSPLPGHTFPSWRPEPRFARWRRQRRQRPAPLRAFGSNPGVYVMDDVDVDELPPSAAITPPIGPGGGPE